MLFLLLSLVAAPADTLDLSLASALELAGHKSPARVEARVARFQSGLSAVKAGAALLPSASGNLGWAKTETRSPFNPDSLVTVEGWNGSLTLAQVVFDPAVFGSVAGSIVYAGYYAADARDKQARLVYDVTAGYLGLLRARLLRDAAASALERAGDNLLLARERERLGAAAGIEVMRAEVARSQAEMDLLSSDKALAAVNAAFLAAAGITERVVVRPTEELSAPSGFAFGDSDSLVAEIERRNPTLKMADKSRAAARIGVVAAAARVLPSVSLYWSSNYSDSSFPTVGSWRDHDAVTRGIEFSFPLLDIKTFVLNLADAGAQSRLARAGAERARLTLRATATAAVLDFSEARQRYDVARRNLELSRELLRLADEQRRLGSLSMFEYLSVETGLAAAQASYVGALADTYIKAAQITYLLGRTDAP
ncbi:MAG: TolC family protein [bacterium]